MGEEKAEEKASPPQPQAQPQVDLNAVIGYLRQRLNDVELENAVLKAQIEGMANQFVASQPPNRAARRQAARKKTTQKRKVK